MKPYYQDDAVTIYHGDCREVLSSISGDAIVTDPPYGVGLYYGSGQRDSPERWRDLMGFLIRCGRSTVPFMVLPCCRIGELPWIYSQIPPDWLICWYKGSPETRSPIGFNDWEPHLVYGKPPAQMHDFFFASPEPFTGGHPCPKPIAWARWLVSRAAAAGQSVIDPFMGSGTTLRAAKDLGRKAIGIEIEERYCEIAAKRCAQEVMHLGPMMATQPENGEMFDALGDAPAGEK